MQGNCSTPETGGTGVSLDDLYGDAPRSMIVITPPFSALEFVQMAGRVNRLTTDGGHVHWPEARLMSSWCTNPGGTRLALPAGAAGEGVMFVRKLVSWNIYWSAACGR